MLICLCFHYEREVVSVLDVYKVTNPYGKLNNFEMEQNIYILELKKVYHMRIELFWTTGHSVLHYL